MLLPQTSWPLIFCLIAACSSKSFEGRVKRQDVDFCKLDDIYTCTSGLCIPRQWLCDGLTDCPDGDDEKNCDVKDKVTPAPTTLKTTVRTTPELLLCSSEEFQCEPTQCVLKSKVCDGNFDCANGADETVCESTTTPGPTCQSDQFHCKGDKLCVPISWRCDGIRDCPRGEDENGCGETTPQAVTTAVPITGLKCRPDQFHCPSDKICVPKVWQCDGMKHCSQGEDENDCPSTTPASVTTETVEITTEATSPLNPNCRPNQFYCQSNNICIPRSWHCDGLAHCEQGEDEESCTITTLEPSTKHMTVVTTPSGQKCKADQFHCEQNNLCIPTPWRCDGEQDCAYGEDEEGCTVTTLEPSTTKRVTQITTPSGQKCQGDQFHCEQNNLCIPTPWRCDGEQDCAYGEDEEGCTVTTLEPSTKHVTEITTPSGPTCAPDQFRCAQSNLCIPSPWRCDGDKDCEHGEDEFNCQESTPAATTQPTTILTTTESNSNTTICTSMQYKCLNMNSCIPLRWVCDGELDCEQGDDERNCSTPKNCNDEEYQCQMGNCIPNGWVCDDQRDCVDGDDEFNCTVRACTAEEFSCEADGNCIQQNWVCDGEADCSDGADEAQDCDIANITCKGNEFFCAANKKCIPAHWQCDGDQDCDDGADEVGCGDTNVTCDANHFQCEEDQRCIPITWMCDNDRDCGDGSDEFGCSTGCESGQYQCANSTSCIAVDSLCNGRAECPLGDDETQNCTKKCEPGSWRCGSSDECIQEAQVCDGTSDCGNGDDESNCTITTPVPTCQGFLCRSTNTCIPLMWQCDGFHDCKGGDDERGCRKSTPTTPLPSTTPSCMDEKFQCDSGECIPRANICDGEHDCNDGSDETNCPTEATTTPNRCPPTAAHCPQSDLCIPEAWVCDGTRDCKFGEDEMNCSYATQTPRPGVKCRDDEYQCEPIQCIPRSKLCDGVQDCANAADEQPSQCPTTTPLPSTPFPVIRCRSDEYQCEPTQCIPRSKLCDGTFNCANAADEQPSQCPTTTPSPSTPIHVIQCRSDEYQCEPTQCIPRSKLCDGVWDCANAADEQPSQCPTTTPWPTTVVPFIQCRDDEYQCEPTQCILRSKLCDGVYDCANSADEQPSQCPTTSEPRTATIILSTTPVKCGDDEYQCEPTQCIPRSRLCDGVYDCANSADEQPSQCPTTQPAPPSTVSGCADQEFQCANGRCVPVQWVCDGDPDCSGGDDEESCGNHTCTSDQFSCDGNRCIPKNWVCDSEEDCQGGEDERNCGDLTCQPNTFRCPSSRQCIPNSWKCDGDQDCANGEDEENCKGSTQQTPQTTSGGVSPSSGPKSTCPEDTFSCGDGNCVYTAWVCDGDRDCLDGSDELSCPAGTTTTRATQETTTSTQKPTDTMTSTPTTPDRPPCSAGEFDCGDRLCIPDIWVCDGIEQCQNGRDEYECPTTLPTKTTVSPCSASQFDCGNGICLPLSWKCDKQTDCPNGADEFGCGVSTTPAPTPASTCQPDQISCGDGTCLPARWRCDGQKDCASGADEAECSDNDNSIKDENNNKENENDLWWLPRGWPFGNGNY